MSGIHERRTSLRSADDSEFINHRGAIGIHNASVEHSRYLARQACQREVGATGHVSPDLLGAGNLKHAPMMPLSIPV